MNVQNIDVRPTKKKVAVETTTQDDQSEINVDDILEKLL
jgi:hypothetical protein